MLKPTEKLRVVPAATIAITAIGILLACAGNASAQPPQRVLGAPAAQPTSASVDALEHAFWVCDYKATTQGNSDISTCTAVYQALKDRKFAGDFDALVSWWRQNKAAQHQSIAVAASQ